jgi:hypothetical protein
VLDALEANLTIHERAGSRCQLRPRSQHHINMIKGVRLGLQVICQSIMVYVQHPLWVSRVWSRRDAIKFVVTLCGAFTLFPEFCDAPFEQTLVMKPAVIAVEQTRHCGHRIKKRDENHIGTSDFQARIISYPTRCCTGSSSRCSHNHLGML